MKNTYKVTLLIALGLASVSTVKAQDLILGFNDAAGPSNAQNDYTVDLGLTGNALLADAAANNGTYNLSSGFSISTFNSAAAFGNDGNALSDVAAGVISAGGNTVSGLTYTFQTSLAGNPPFAGESAQQLGVANSDASGVAAGVQSSATAGGWSSEVAVSPGLPGSSVSSSVASEDGNPLGQLNSGVLDLTLWDDTKTGGLHPSAGSWVDDGTIAINLNNDTVEFTSVAAVPEPSTFGLFAGAGLLAVALRRQFSLKNS
jgi:hypothetical protein